MEGSKGLTGTIRDKGRPRFETESSRFKDLVEIEGSWPRTESGLPRLAHGSTTSDCGRGKDSERRSWNGMLIGCEKFCETRLIGFGGEGVGVSTVIVPMSSSGS